MDLQHTHTIVSYRKQCEGSPCLSHTNFFSKSYRCTSSGSRMRCGHIDPYLLQLNFNVSGRHNNVCCCSSQCIPPHRRAREGRKARYSRSGASLASQTFARGARRLGTAFIDNDQPIRVANIYLYMPYVALYAVAISRLRLGASLSEPLPIYLSVCLSVCHGPSVYCKSLPALILHVLRHEFKKPLKGRRRETRTV